MVADKREPGIDDNRVVTTRRSVVLAPEQGKHISYGPVGSSTFKVVGAESGDQLLVYETVVRPRTAGPPAHLHRGCDESFYVLEGEMTYLVGGRTVSAPAGSFVYVPRGILHTFWNASASPARQLTIFTPAGMEGYLEQLAQAVERGADALDRVNALMEAHDMVVPPSTRAAYGQLEVERRSHE